jgi:DNA helicase-2/ATP-dependent DNA helicase PcrA
MFTWPKGTLNGEQEDAIAEAESVFLVACPGSGKTRVLTYKTALELSKLGSSKQFVVAITYTHRAADEIHERIEGLGVDTSRLWIGTIHSFCLEWILKPYGIYHNDLKHGFRVIDTHEREKLLESLCAPYKNPKVTVWDCEFYFDESGYCLSSHKKWLHDSVNEILEAYFRALQETRQIDFELILFRAYELIQKHSEIALILSRLFSLVLVDEYQDTKRIQYSIIASILKAGQGSTRGFLVGDPNQAIFQSLGGFAIDFEDFKAMAGIPMKLFSLSKNYRSSERIILYFGNYNLHDTPIVAASADKAFPSLVSFDDTIPREVLEVELARLIRYNIETLGIPPHEVCVLAPQWVHLASMTRRLVAAMPEYSFDGPGMVPFARDIDNFWYKVSKLALTDASPGMYVRRLRWAGDVIRDLDVQGIDVSAITRKSLLRECNAIRLAETDGLDYLRAFFEELFKRLGINFRMFAVLVEHREAFFASSQAKVDRLVKDGVEFIGDVVTFKKVFQARTGIVVSTIHGIKGAEFDAVLAYALLEGLVPNSSDLNGQDSAMKLLYVIGSRARKNLHLIAERGRHKWNKDEYQTTQRLAACVFNYDLVVSPIESAW